MNEPATGFGAPWSTPQRTAAVLRGQASAAGLRLAPVAPVEAAAAVLGAHGWVSACGGTSLAQARYQPTGVLVAAAAVLTRAAGQAATVDVPTVLHAASTAEPLACPHPLMQALAPALAWARDQLDEPEELAAACAAAASDLLGAGTHPVAAVGWLLLTEAEAAFYGTH